MIKFKEGNILDATEDIICQSVNHQGVMGAGLAKQILFKYPEIQRLYFSYCRTIPFERIRKEGIVYWFYTWDNKLIASIFGQDEFGIDKQYTDYTSLANGLNTVISRARDNGLSTAIPSHIGCGLGGGDWNVVLGIIEDLLSYTPKLPVTIYHYEKETRKIR